MKKTAFALITPLLFTPSAQAVTLFDGLYAGIATQIQFNKSTAEGTIAQNGVTAFNGKKTNNNVSFNPHLFAGYGLVMEDIMYFGGEASYTFSPKKTRIDFGVPGVAPQTIQTKNAFTATARTGTLVAENILIYAGAGVQAQQVTAKTGRASKSKTALAATPIVGAEMMVTESIGIRIEGGAALKLTGGPKVEEQSATTKTAIKTKRTNYNANVGILYKIFTPATTDPAALGIPTEVPEIPSAPTIPPAPEAPTLF